MQKTESHIYIIMAFCSSGDLSHFIKKRGEVESLVPHDPRSSGSSASLRPLYPHPKDGGLNEAVVRCFLGQLGPSAPASRS